MANMTYRTTFTLDAVAVARLTHLSQLWHVSQAEVIRRALEVAEKQAQYTYPDPAHELELYLAEGGLPYGDAEKYLKELDTDRKQWRSE